MGFALNLIESWNVDAASRALVYIDIWIPPCFNPLSSSIRHFLLATIDPFSLTL
ncbi:hypothetical protein JHK84_030424 [Glycine max]|nr:hypothetical protein JHK84_030424 [Glycine max]